MKSSMLEMFEAAREVDTARTARERDEAVERFADAERAHLKKLGYGDPTSKTARTIPILLIVGLVVILFVGIRNTSHISDLTDQNRAAQFATCERTNDARVASVQNLRNDRHNLRNDLHFLKSLPPSQGLSAFIAKKVDSIAAKTEAIHGAIAANAPVAVHPGSVRADCVRAVDRA